MVKKTSCSDCLSHEYSHKRVEYTSSSAIGNRIAHGPPIRKRLSYSLTNCRLHINDYHEFTMNCQYEG